jgi:replicative DNA helicase
MAEPATALENKMFRTPPHNIEAEQALLGAILVNNQTFEKVAEFLLPEHFADAAHAKIFAAIGKLQERGQIANPITLKPMFDQDELLRDVGGAQYLVQLAANIISVINAADYGYIIYELFLRRQLITLGEDVVNEAYSLDLEHSAREHIERTEKRLYDLVTSGEGSETVKTFKDAVNTALSHAEAAYKRDGKLAGVATGFDGLDRLLGGLHPSDLLILAGRPSMGKTSLATNIAFYCASHIKWLEKAGKKFIDEGAVVGFFSLEMSAEQLAARILSEQSGIASEKIRRGDLTNDEFQKLVESTQTLNTLQLYIDDTPAITVTALRTRARRLKRQFNLGMIIVDYLQLMRGSSTKTDNRVQEISEITRGLKAIAKELHVPVIALSQLSRAVENRDNKRPQLADLRESGSIEQDADVVMFVYREEYYLKRDEPAQKAGESTEKFLERMQDFQQRCEKAEGMAEVIIAKQRHGPIGTITLCFDGSTTRFYNAVDRAYLPEQYE